MKQDHNVPGTGITTCLAPCDAGIAPDEPLGIPSLYPSRWMAVGLAMAIVEGGRQPDVFPMMRGWTLARVGQ